MSSALQLQCYPPAITFLIAMLLATAEPSIAAIAEPAGGTVGFAAVELTTGRTLGPNQDNVACDRLLALVGGPQTVLFQLPDP